MKLRSEVVPSPALTVKSGLRAGAQGTVKWFAASPKGAFITPDDGGQDLVHS